MSICLDFKMIHQTFCDHTALENHKILINKKGTQSVVDKGSAETRYKINLGTFLNSLFKEVQKQDIKTEDLEKVLNISNYFVKKLNNSNTFLSKIKSVFQRIHNFITGNGFRTNLQIARQIQNYLFPPLNTYTDQQYANHISHRPFALQELQTLSPDELDQNWNLNKYFGHVYVINLDDRQNSADPQKFKRRLDRITDDLNQIGGCAFERLRATYGAHELAKDVWNRVNDNSFGLQGEALDKSHMGQAGCFMSHYRTIKDANDNYIQAQKDLQNAQAFLNKATTEQEKKEAHEMIKTAENKVKEYSSILIIEDDNGFGFVNKINKEIPAAIDLKGAGVQFRKAMNDLPEDWDMLYLLAVECKSNGVGWEGQKTTIYSHNLNRLQYGLLANAIAINSQAYSTILKSLSKIDNPKKTYRPVDHEYALLHKSIKAFTPVKALAYQAAGESTITDGKLNEPWNGTWDRGF